MKRTSLPLLILWRSDAHLCRCWFLGAPCFLASRMGEADVVNSYGRFAWYELMTSDVEGGLMKFKITGLCPHTGNAATSAQLG